MNGKKSDSALTLISMVASCSSFAAMIRIMDNIQDSQLKAQVMIGCLALGSVGFLSAAAYADYKARYSQ